MTMPRLALLTVAVASLTAPVKAQSAGNGYLFGAPNVRFIVRGGYAYASAGSDLFSDATTFLTLEKGDFSGPSIGGELAFRIAPRVELSFNTDYSAAVSESEDREYYDNNQLPIVQATSFRRAPMTVNAIVSLRPRGRSVGSLAWIPTKVVPWIGAGGGTMWYRFRQEGDFVDYQTLNVLENRIYESSGWAPALQALGGVDVTLSPRIGFTADLRGTWARAELSRDFVGYEKIDLSGVTGALGFTLRM
jgi:hypothetical protein